MLLGSDEIIKKWKGRTSSHNNLMDKYTRASGKGGPKWEMAGFGARPRSRNSGAAPFTSSSELSLVCRNAPLVGHSV